jgi:hypothetical protein
MLRAARCFSGVKWTVANDNRLRTRNGADRNKEPVIHWSTLLRSRAKWKSRLRPPWLVEQFSENVSDLKKDTVNAG